MVSWPSEITPAMGTGRPCGPRRSNRPGLWRSRQQAPCQQDFAGEAVAQHPQDFVADVRLQAIDGQDDPALVAQERHPAARDRRWPGPEFVVAVQEVGDGAEGDDDAAAVRARWISGTLRCSA